GRLREALEPDGWAEPSSEGGPTRRGNELASIDLLPLRHGSILNETCEKRLAAERERSAASRVVLQSVQHAQSVLVRAGDAAAPPCHVPEILQPGGVAPGAEPQQRRAGVAQLTQQGPSGLPVEPRVIPLIHCFI